MLLSQPTNILVLLIPTLLFALCFHEYAHAMMAYRLGDDTAARMGRLTINPLVHIDPMGALLILFVGFGWAKPVPVNVINLRNPRSDMMKIAFAGPASNLLLALIGGLLFRVMIISGLTSATGFISITKMLLLFIQINIMLAVFNLLPITPLDGSRIFTGMIANKYPDFAHQMNMHGPKVLLGILLLGYLTNIHIFWWILSPFLTIFMYIFAGIRI